MNNLSDTHALIWFLNGDDELSDKARLAIENDHILYFLSIASLWEIAIKLSLDKLKLAIPFAKISDQIANNGFQEPPITFEDTLIVYSLPFNQKDPFDRIIIS